MVTKQKRVTKKDEAEIERLRRQLKENDERLRLNVDAKGAPLPDAYQANLREIVAVQREKLNAITSRLDDAPLADETST